MYLRSYKAKLTTISFTPKKWSHKSLVIDNSARSYKWEIFFIFFIRFVFFPEKNVFVTLQIDWRTVQVLRFSVIWRTSAFSQFWEVNCFLLENFRSSYRRIKKFFSLIFTPIFSKSLSAYNKIFQFDKCGISYGLPI